MSHLHPSSRWSPCKKLGARMRHCHSWLSASSVSNSGVATNKTCCRSSSHLVLAWAMWRILSWNQHDEEHMTESWSVKSVNTFSVQPQKCGISSWANFGSVQASTSVSLLRLSSQAPQAATCQPPHPSLRVITNPACAFCWWNPVHKSLWAG